MRDDAPPDPPPGPSGGGPGSRRDGAAAWQRAVEAAALFAVDPHGLGGVALRARTGPARRAWLDLLADLLPGGVPLRRCPAGIGDDRLIGGLDLAATLQTGRPVAERGLLSAADGGVVTLTMAERTPGPLAARLAAALDNGAVTVARDGLEARLPARIGLVALDEGAAEEERLPDKLADRLAFCIELGSVSLKDMIADAPDDDDVAAARERLPAIAPDERLAAAVCETAAALGVASLRAPMLALKAARAAAALSGRSTVEREDLALAVGLVLAPRATQIPTPPQEDEPAPEEDAETAQDRDEAASPDDPADNGGEDRDMPSPEDLAEMLIAAAQAALPEDLLARMAHAKRRGAARAAGAGAMRAAKARGRPAGLRRGSPRGGARLNLIATLRAAAPWQPLRRAERGGGDAAGLRRVEVRSSDFRITRYKHKTETTTIFAVDASGSAALARLAEAKGAVELLLADCYVRRDKVAVIGFRGQSAELLLPPTRSLTRAKRALAGLPGGGGTPLAAGLHAARTLAEAALRRQDTPILVVLTDGRANVAADGAAGRKQAHEDALTAAVLLRVEGVAALLVDTSPRGQDKAEAVAAAMGAQYLRLPSADASALSDAVKREAAAAKERA